MVRILISEASDKETYCACTNVAIPLRKKMRRSNDRFINYLSENAPEAEQRHPQQSASGAAQ
jgi:hypothetical protein